MEWHREKQSIAVESNPTIDSTDGTAPGAKIFWIPDLVSVGGGQLFGRFDVDHFCDFCILDAQTQFKLSNVVRNDVL